jgi:colanic acid/amylovoran biosynthesis glycosyltransferase
MPPDGSSRVLYHHKLAYLVSEYPATSHTFIMREVRGLRALNWDIQVASINTSSRTADELTLEEREELQRTFYVKAVGLSGALRAHGRVLFKRPWAYLRGLARAIGISGGDPRRTLKAVLYFAEAIVLGEWMRLNKLGHLHVHFASEGATVGLIVSVVFPIKFSLTVHGPDEFYNTRGYYLREKIAGASFIACISHFARSQLMQFSPPKHWEKLQLAPLGVDSNLFRPAGCQTRRASIEVLCVGRLAPAKGQHVLVAAIARLQRSGHNVHLTLVGSGPDRQSLDQEVKCRGLSDSVSFEGSVNQEHIRKIYSQADFFALASFAEGVPVVLMEAMAMEIPCVSTHICGIPELIRDGVDGLLVAPSDERGLADAIARLIDDSELRRQLGSAGRRRVIERYELSVSVKRLSRLFKKYAS